jgi:hypothetical protein
MGCTALYTRSPCLPSQLACRPAARVSSFLGRAVGRASPLIALQSVPANAEWRRTLPTRRRAQQQVAAGVNVAWLVAGAALGGLLLGLAVAKWAQLTFKNEFNHTQSTAENAQLRAKVRARVPGRLLPCGTSAHYACSIQRTFQVTW